MNQSHLLAPSPLPLPSPCVTVCVTDLLVVHAPQHQSPRVAHPITRHCWRWAMCREHQGSTWLCAAFTQCCAVPVSCKLCMWNILITTTTKKKSKKGSDTNCYFEKVLPGKKTVCVFFAQVVFVGGTCSSESLIATLLHVFSKGLIFPFFFVSLVSTSYLAALQLGCISVGLNVNSQPFSGCGEHGVQLKEHSMTNHRVLSGWRRAVPVM